MSETILACGLTTIDITYRVDEVPAANQKVAASGLTFDVGGPAANGARTARALGSEVTLVTALGESAGALAAKDLLSGLTVVDVAPEDFTLALSSILVDARGDRTVVSTNARGVTRTEAPPSVERVDAVLVDGHLMETAIQVAEQAQRAGTPVIFDGGSYKPGTEDLLSHVTAAAVSADFAFPRHPNTLQRILDLGADVAIQTHENKPLEMMTVRGRTWIPVPEVEVVDTLGAGDVFHGALAVAFARGMPPQEAAEFAAEIASRSVAHEGALGWARS